MCLAARSGEDFSEFFRTAYSLSVGGYWSSPCLALQPDEFRSMICIHRRTTSTQASNLKVAPISGMRRLHMGGPGASIVRRLTIRGRLLGIATGVS